MQQMVESKRRVFTLKKEEGGTLRGRWTKAVNGKENIKKWTIQGLSELNFGI
jgi:hypothetical protein